jgi:hypothetical protein
MHGQPHICYFVYEITVLLPHNVTISEFQRILEAMIKVCLKTLKKKFGIKTYIYTEKYY